MGTQGRGREEEGWGAAWWSDPVLTLSVDLLALNPRLLGSPNPPLHHCFLISPSLSTPTFTHLPGASGESMGHVGRVPKDREHDVLSLAHSSNMVTSME